ncbi:MAG TPA: secretin and TonB N-terminal domain-containing protein [Rhodocyclaceae bacterium]|nr:secretin and TonB N-terminal domain-containing protein [Rhodocyclaceae bacterium]
MRLTLPLLVTLALIGGCAGNIHYKEGRELIAAGRSEEGLARLEQAVREFPSDREGRAYYFTQRDLAVSEWSAAAETARSAGKLTAAEVGWNRILRVDPNNVRARTGLAELEATRRRQRLLMEAEALIKKKDRRGAEARLRTILAEDPAHDDARTLMTRLQEEDAKSPGLEPAVRASLSKPITLDFRDTALKTVLEVISRTADLNFVLDKDVRGDARVTIFVRNAGIEEVLRLILTTNQLQYRAIGENSILVFPAMGVKQKEYQENATRSFYLANIEAKQAVNLLKSIVKAKDLYVDEKLNLVVMRDTPEAIRLAERLILSVDLAEPEVMLELEVLELSRNRLLDLGINYPDQVGYGLLQPTTTTTVTTATGFAAESTNLGGALASGMVNLHNRTGLTPYVANPAAVLNLKNQTGDGTLLANPRIRVKNREKAKIHIGEKLPIFTTTTTANVGVAASVSYLDVGLKLDVEPTVHLDDEVDIKVGLEVSSVAREVSGPANSLAYQIGTRSATTVLRLKDGETQVLAGLINDEERSSANRLPGLGDLPIIGRLFSEHRDSHNNTEIVLLVTPRIVRNIARAPLPAATFPAGTDNAIGAPPLVVSSGRVGLSSQPTPGGSPAFQPVEDASGSEPEPETEGQPGMPAPVPAQPAPMPPTPAPPDRPNQPPRAAPPP